MPNSLDYRLYLESEFKGLHSLMNAQFETVHERLDKIETQTTRTNGRVTKLEDVVHNDLTHTKDGCPQGEVIEEIKNYITKDKAVRESKEKEVVVSHSDRVRVLMLIGICASIIMGAVSVFFSYHGKQVAEGVKTEVDMINTPVKTRGGVIQWYPSGVVIDSLKKQ